jgi:hypothetical protein
LAGAERPATAVATVADGATGLNRGEQLISTPLAAVGYACLLGTAVDMRPVVFYVIEVDPPATGGFTLDLCRNS